MAILAFDPGYNYSGFAYYNGPDDWMCRQFFEPLEVFEYALVLAVPGDEVVIEDYSHGGIFTKEAKETLRVVGFLDLSFQRRSYPTFLVNKDARLSAVREARAMVSEVYNWDNPNKKESKDAISALAHAIAYHRKSVSE